MTEEKRQTLYNMLIQEAEENCIWAGEQVRIEVISAIHPLVVDLIESYEDD